MKPRPFRVAVAVAALLALSAAPALATHTHVLQVGNGECTILAANGHENEVILPLPVWNNPNVDAGSSDTTRMHPLHVLVHLGVPGDQQHLAVAGTAAAGELCPNGIVND